MRVACPNCSAEYDLPPAVVARLDGARTVRCARCGTTWAPPPPVAEALPPGAPVPPVLESRPAPDPVAARTMAPPAPPSTAPSPMPELPPPPAPATIGPPAARPTPPPAPSPTSSRSADDGPRVALAWTLSLVLLAAAAWAAWHYRAEVMAAWPPSTRAYAALGLIP